MATTSTYLLDTSKKCTLTGFNSSSFKNTDYKDKDVYWSWYGDVDSKCLQNLGASFTENFKSGTKYAEETLEKTLKPVGMAMNAVVKQIPMMKNVNFEKEDTLRNTAIFLYAIWNAFTGKDDAEATALINDFTYGYNYNIPYRADMPILEPLGGSKLTIHFAYGKCNLFSAKKEVWEPLTHLKTALFPTVVDSQEYKGLMKMGPNTVPAPYPQQIAVKAINQIFMDAVDTAKNTAYKAYDVITDMTNTATNLQDMGAGDVQIKEVEFKDGWISNTEKYFKYSDTYYKNLRDAAKAVYSGAGDDINRAWKTNNDNKNDDGTADYNVDAEEYMQLAKDKALMDANSGDEQKSITWPKRAFSVKDAVDKGASAIKDSNKITLTSNSGKGKTQESMPNILKSLINFVPKKVGSVTSDFYGTLSKYAYSIKMGYPSVNKTNLEDLADVLGVVTPMVSMQDILFTKVDIKFDFDHKDEYGYPMAGDLIIEKVWNLTYPDRTFTLSSKGNEKLNTNPLKY